MTPTRKRSRKSPLDANPVAFVYLRISLAAELALRRQSKACRALCEARGWKVGAVYADDGISAYAGKTRPDFERMLSDAVDHDGPVVIVSLDIDRLSRRVSELTRLIDLYDNHAVPFVTVQGGVDLTSPAGKLIATILTAVAEMESAHKAERMCLRYDQDRENGRPHWAYRPFGFHLDGDGHVAGDPFAGEAEEVGRLYTRFVAGAQLRALADGLNADGWTQPARVDKRTGATVGKPWTYDAVRKVLRSERNAGLLPDGTRGAWKPLTDADTYAKAVAILDANADTYGTDNKPRHLLTGLLACGGCGKRMTTHNRADKGRAYLCRRDRGGCGMVVKADPVDDIVSGAVVDFLAAPANRAGMVIPGEASEDAATHLAEIQAAERAREEVLATIDPELGVTKVHVAPRLRDIAKREEAARARLAKVRTASPALRLPEDPAALRLGWEVLGLEEQRAIIADVLEPVRIMAGKAVGPTFDPSRVVVRHRYPVAA